MSQNCHGARHPSFTLQTRVSQIRKSAVNAGYTRVQWHVWEKLGLAKECQTTFEILPGTYDQLYH